jgi:prepilin-type N-terminal cleavage/methylation domain-containing protein
VYIACPCLTKNGIETGMIKRRQIVQSRLKNNGGFTLIEVIAVLIILAIITAVAVTRSMSTQNDLIPQADTVKTHLRFAQMKALNDDINIWSMVFTTNSYTLSCTGSNCPSSTIQIPSESSNSHSFPSDVTINPGTTVTFDRWGSPGGSDVIVNLIQGSKTIAITVGANTGYITP